MFEAGVLFGRYASWTMRQKNSDSILLGSE